MYVFVCYGGLTMEARVAEREAEMTEWNDGRLDDLDKKVDKIDQKVDRLDKKVEEQGRTMLKEFGRVDKRLIEIDGRLERFDERFEEFGRRFEGLETGILRINDRLDGFHRTLFQAAVTFVVGGLGLIGLLVGIVAS